MLYIEKVKYMNNYFHGLILIHMNEQLFVKKLNILYKSSRTTRFQNN